MLNMTFRFPIPKTVILWCLTKSKRQNFNPNCQVPKSDAHWNLLALNSKNHSPHLHKREAHCRAATFASNWKGALPTPWPLYGHQKWGSWIGQNSKSEFQSYGRYASQGPNKKNAALHSLPEKCFNLVRTSLYTKPFDGYMGVSKNRGIPKSSILIGFPL